MKDVHILYLHYRILELRSFCNYTYDADAFFILFLNKLAAWRFFALILGRYEMKRSRKNLVFTLTFTFILMALLVIFTSKVIFRTAFSSVQELGDDKATAITADLENYIDTAKSVLWVAADTVDHMVGKGATNEQIIEYITRESEKTEMQFDASYTGIYGYIEGEYVDGVGWIPPEDYNPTERDWYKTSVAAKGEVVIVSPYVDAQTGSVIISIGRALSGYKNALALDLTLDGVQEIVEDITINGYGSGFIVNNDGLVIAHHDKSENGKNYDEMEEHHALFQKVKSVGKGCFETEMNGDVCTVFVDQVMEQWYLVIIIKNSELYKAPMYLLLVSIVINLVVFLLISTFYLIGYRSETKFNTRMEEMKEIERKKDYEAKVLKLEKSAADSANKAKSDFLADMSHEIRTPINAILGMNEMILHESGEADIKDYASNIKSAGTTLLSIINSILDFSKIEDGRMSLVPAEFDTTKLINDLVHSISERAKEKQLELKLDIDETLPSRLLGDDVRISQVIMNLLTNAVKYTEKGYVKLSIKNMASGGDEKKLLVSVKDTGIGIRKEDIDKLAISFERVDEKRNRHIEGTGLGISIVTRLLIMMKSELKIKSEYGKGSEFYFELPIDVVDPTPIGKYEPNGRQKSRTELLRINMSAPKAKVILTDDNEMNRKVAANLMKLFGIKPTMCESGRKTIEEMTKNRYDILFLDHMMPEMDGIETLKLLKDKYILGNTKVVALTANAVVGAREQYIGSGFDDYLSKPIQIPELENILRRYLDENLIEAPIEPGETKREKQNDSKVKQEENQGVNNLKRDASEDRIVSGDVTDMSGSSGEHGKMERLREIGISVETGISYCGEDEDFYLEVLNDYVAAVSDRIEKLTGFLNDENMKDYKILIHSVKSSAKTIGDMSLFEKAKDLEAAASAGNLSYVKEKHDPVLKEYRDMASAIGKIIN